jgi:hypothetical protein
LFKINYGLVPELDPLPLVPAPDAPEAPELDGVAVEPLAPELLAPGEDALPWLLPLTPDELFVILALEPVLRELPELEPLLAEPEPELY